MSVVIHAAHLRHEMRRRGWTSTDLARESRLSNATISATLAGRAISEQSLALIAKALSRTPILDLIDALIASENPGAGLD